MAPLPTATNDFEPTPINTNARLLSTQNTISSNSNGNSGNDDKGRNNQQQRAPKLHSVMEAANALTALCDDDDDDEAAAGNGNNVEKTSIKVEEKNGNNASSSGSSTSNSNNKASNNSGSNSNSLIPKPTKRFIPEHKKPDAALTFPEKLMSLMKFADEQEDISNYCIAWLEDGGSFVIRDPDTFTRQVLPKFFKATKFSSFTRKLYRWGFRQVNRGIGPDDPIIFGNEHFLRDDPEQMKKMRSVTAASTRKTEQANLMLRQQQQQQQQQQFALNMMNMNKRPFDATGGMNGGNDPKRMLLEQWMQQKAMTQQNMYNPNAGSSMNLTSALGRNPHFNPSSLSAGGMKPYEMMGFGNGINNNTNNGAGSHVGQIPPTNPLFNSFQMQALGQQQSNDNNQLHHQQATQFNQQSQQQAQFTQQQMHMQQQMQQQQTQFNQQQMQMQQMQQQQQQQQQQQMQQQMHQGNGYPANSSTADIVSAAINALKYAS